MYNNWKHSILENSIKSSAQMDWEFNYSNLWVSQASLFSQSWINSNKNIHQELVWQIYISYDCNNMLFHLCHLNIQKNIAITLLLEAHLFLDIQWCISSTAAEIIHVQKPN